MKLSQVLSQVTQIEKTKFVSRLDSLRTKAISNDNELSQRLENPDSQLRTASSGEITQLFQLLSQPFSDHLREQIWLGGAQLALLVNILARDGNSIARLSWIESLYAREHERINRLSEVLAEEISSAVGRDDYDRGNRLSIYKSCCETAFQNDLRLNSEAKITDDERTILNTLFDRLGMSHDEAFAIEHMITPIPAFNVGEALNSLKEIGLVFISKRKGEVLIADEIVSILHRIQNKELADKYVLRILRSLTDAELSNLLRRYGQKSRGVSRQDKISFVLHAGIPITNILVRDIFDASENLGQRKDRLKNLIDDLEISVSRLGTTLENRASILINALKSSADAEFELLSVSGFKELLQSLSNTTPPVLERLRHEFEIEESEELEPERLRALGISPLDILYVYSNEEVKGIRNSMGLPKRNDPRLSILNSFASANDKLLEQYELLASRDLAGLQAVGINLKEAEIGLKFEEITKTIFEQLGLEVDEDLRKQVSTKKDRPDIVLSIGDEDVIVGEVKSFKNGDFAKYSQTARQVKSYVNRCEVSGKRVSQVLIVAPGFSQDFIEAAEMDTEVNISLLDATGLKRILTAYKSRRTPKFSARLLTKGGLLKSDLIAKSI